MIHGWDQHLPVPLRHVRFGIAEGVIVIAVVWRQVVKMGERGVGVELEE